MTKKVEVDVEKSLGYQANGRLKKENVETAKLAIKKFVCPDCQHEEEAAKKVFGEAKICQECGSVMLNQY
jgi:hypothetical protein